MNEECLTMTTAAAVTRMPHDCACPLVSVRSIPPFPIAPSIPLFAIATPPQRGGRGSHQQNAVRIDRERADYGRTDGGTAGRPGRECTSWVEIENGIKGVRSNFDLPSVFGSSPWNNEGSRSIHSYSSPANGTDENCSTKRADNPKWVNDASR